MESIEDKTDYRLYRENFYWKISKKNEFVYTVAREKNIAIEFTKEFLRHKSDCFILNHPKGDCELIEIEH